MPLKLRAPKFWDHPNPIAQLLAPLGKLYGLIAANNVSRTRPAHADVPVIAVGNITMGGAGKTPVTIALTHILKRMGYGPHILTRGYRAEETRDPIEVDPKIHAPAQVGDEPLLLARYAPTWVFPERHKSARLAVGRGADLLLMDDGLQHHALYKDVSFLVIDTSYQLGNGHIFPAGPLRESLAAALERTSAVVALGTNPLTIALPRLKPVFRAALVPTHEWAELKGQDVIAFAGLGRTEKFFTMCEKAGMNVIERHPFPDHHPYTRTEIIRLIEHASMMDARLVTTEKDAVKIHAEERNHIRTLRIEVMWQDEPALEQFLRDHLAALHTPDVS